MEARGAPALSPRGSENHHASSHLGRRSGGSGTDDFSAHASCARTVQCAHLPVRIWRGEFRTARSSSRKKHLHHLVTVQRHCTFRTLKPNPHPSRTTLMQSVEAADAAARWHSSDQSVEIQQTRARYGDPPS